MAAGTTAWSDATMSTASARLPFAITFRILRRLKSIRVAKPVTAKDSGADAILTQRGSDLAGIVMGSAVLRHRSKGYRSRLVGLSAVPRETLRLE